MDRIAHDAVSQTELEDITRREVELYAGHAFKAMLYSLLDDVQKRYAVVAVPDNPQPFPSRVVLLAQVVDDKIVIVEDNTDKPLVDALMLNGGVPREQIVLAYRGEQLTDTLTNVKE